MLKQNEIEMKMYASFKIRAEVVIGVNYLIK